MGDQGVQSVIVICREVLLSETNIVQQTVSPDHLQPSGLTGLRNLRQVRLAGHVCVCMCVCIHHANTELQSSLAREPQVFPVDLKSK